MMSTVFRKNCVERGCYGEDEEDDEDEVDDDIIARMKNFPKDWQA